MNNSRTNKFFYLIILCALFIGTQFVNAVETFQNNLQKVDLFKDSTGGVKIVLVTNKPYNDSIAVIKKTDFKYVILMPETSNSLSSKPILKLVSNVVNNVDVKTQGYQNQAKGYTKITISTTKPIAITTKVEVLNAPALQLRKKYSNKMPAQTTKKTVAVKKVTPKTNLATKKYTPSNARKSTTTKYKTYPKSTRKIKSNIIAQKTVTVPKAVRAVSKVTTPKAVVPKYVTPKVAPKPVQKSVQKPVQKAVTKPKPIQPQKAAVPQIVVKKVPKTFEQKPIQQIKTEPIKKSIEKPVEKKVAPTAVKKPAQTAEETMPVQKAKQTKETPTTQTIPDHALHPSIKKEDIQNAGSDRAPDVIVPPITSLQENIEPAIKPVTAPVAQPAGTLQQITGFITKNITAAIPLILIALVLILLKLKKKKTGELPEQEPESTSNLSEEPTPSQDFNPNTEIFSDEDVFGEDEDMNFNEDMSWKEKFQTYVDESHPESEENIIAQDETTQENPDFEGLFNDDAAEEFFDEEFQTEFPQNEEAQEEIEEIEEVEDVGFLEDLEELQEEYLNDETMSEYNLEDEIGNEDVSIDALLDDIEQENATKAIFAEETTVEEIAEVEEEQDELIKSEFAIDNQKGFYLVDFEDTTALVGHINEEIFILKRFNEKISAPLQARLNEKKEFSASYMTRVGSFKGIVEVTPYDMNLLIEL